MFNSGTAFSLAFPRVSSSVHISAYGPSIIPSAPSSPNSLEYFIYYFLSKCVKMSSQDIWGRRGGKSCGSSSRLGAHLLSHFTRTLPISDLMPSYNHILFHTLMIPNSQLQSWIVSSHECESSMSNGWTSARMYSVLQSQRVQNWTFYLVVGPSSLRCCSWQGHSLPTSITPTFQAKESVNRE